MKERIKLISKSLRCCLNKIKKIKKNSEVLILFDSDCDGVTSAVIMHKLMESLGINHISLKVFDHEVHTLRVKKNFDIVMFLDLPQISKNVIEKIKGKAVIIDHHPPKNYPKYVTYCNPRKIKRSVYIPTSCLCYFLYKKIVKKNDVCWISGIGIIGDKGVKECSWVFKDIKKIFPELLDEISEKNIYNSLLSTLAKIINSVRLVNYLEYVKVAKYLAKIKSYNSIVSGKDKISKFLLKTYFETEEEIEKLMKKFEKEKMEFKKVIYFEVKSKYKIRSTLASIISSKLKTKKVVAIGQEDGRYFKVSLRGKNAFMILEKVKNKIPGAIGGGHPQACSLKLPIKFKNCFISNLK